MQHRGIRELRVARGGVAARGLVCRTPGITAVPRLLPAGAQLLCAVRVPGAGRALAGRAARR